MNFKTCAAALGGLLLQLCLTGTALAAAPTPFQWPAGIRAAVSLAYDDALDSQLDQALPALDRHGLKGSFYLTMASNTIAQRLPLWRAAAKNGHELGNHSLFHQCSRSTPGANWVQPERNLDTTSAAQMRDQVRLASVFLHAIDGLRERTFTVPCGQTQASDGDYLPLVAADFVAVKASMGNAVTPSMHTLNPAAVQVAVPVGSTGEELIALVKAAGAKGTMVNFTFHGIGSDHLAVSTEAHETLLRFLAEHRSEYWTDTFLNLMKYVKTQQAKTAARP